MIKVRVNGEERSWGGDPSLPLHPDLVPVLAEFLHGR